MFRSLAAAGCVVLAGLFGATNSSAAQPEEKRNVKDGPWGKPFDGLVCRLTIQPKVAMGQPIRASIEIKNISEKRRYIYKAYLPGDFEVVLEYPDRKVKHFTAARGPGINVSFFDPIEPGQIIGNDFSDLTEFFRDLNPRSTDVIPGRYAMRLRFSSPKVPATDKVGNTRIVVPPDLWSNQWVGEIEAAPQTFDVAPLRKEDFVVHEWGVFTVFNDAKYANADRKKEWGDLPAFFYRQFPTERLRWEPANWKKPLIYLYARPTPMHVTVKVTFAGGAPVVWWPAAADPADDGGWLPADDPGKRRPFQSLTWDCWVGGGALNWRQFAGGFEPAWIHWRGKRDNVAATRLEDFPLPADCWLQQARLPKASQLTVIGNILGQPKIWSPGGKTDSKPNVSSITMGWCQRPLTSTVKRRKAKQ